MRSQEEIRQILALWEQGKTKAEIARITRTPRWSVRDYIVRYKSLSQFEEMLISRQIPPSNTSPDSTPRSYQLMIPRSRSYTDEDLKQAVACSESIAEVLRALELRSAGGNYAIVKARIKELGLDTSHFRGSNWLKGKRNPMVRKLPLEEVLKKDSTYTNTHHLKERLISEGYFEHRCVICGLTEWRGQPIPLEIDHINGDRRDNRIENLRLLCPNCHALTPTYRGKNMNVNGSASS